jgi:periplasmic protein TonB
MLPYDQQKPSRRLWISAALTALLLHGGGAALAVVHLNANDLDGGLGAAGAEFAIEMASPNVDDNDAPPGPDSAASQASPEQSQQTAELKESELPKDTPTETEDADRVVSPNEAKKPNEEEQKVAAVQTEASVETPAQQESSRKKLDDSAPPAETAKAPNPGLGKDMLKLTEDWGRKISAYFELHKRYPEGKKRSAKVTVSLVLNRLGNVVSVAVQQSSGDPSFDEAAVSMIRRSDPVPAPPAGLKDDQYSFSLDVNFNHRAARL